MGWGHQYPKLGGKAEPRTLLGEGMSVFFFFFFLSDVEFCSCSWQPATPEGNSSLRLPTGEPCPCRAELDGAQTEHSPTQRRDGAVRAAVGAPCPGLRQCPWGLPGTAQSCSQPCPCVVPNLPQKHLLSSASNALSVEGMMQKHSGTTTTTAEALKGHHHPACWSHTHPTQPWVLGPKVSQPSLVLEQEDRLPQER